MRSSPDGGRHLDSVLLLFLFACFLLLSPLRDWWAAEHNSWLLPYLLWLGVIVLIFWLTRRRGHHDL